MPRTSLIAVLTVILLLFSAIAGTAAESRKTSTTKSFLSGIASFYSSHFHGRPTASGERYNKRAMTAAHPSFPFGTLVRVFNTRNGRSTVVRINDRGPFHGGRIIDVSTAAAKALGFLSHGMARVKLEVLHLPGSGPVPKHLNDLIAEADPEPESPELSADPELAQE